LRQRRRERLDPQRGIRVGECDAVEKVIALWGATSKGQGARQRAVHEIIQAVQVQDQARR
jgi:hypothetical protein